MIHMMNGRARNQTEMPRQASPEPRGQSGTAQPVSSLATKAVGEEEAETDGTKPSATLLPKAVRSTWDSLTRTRVRIQAGKINLNPAARKGLGKHFPVKCRRPGIPLRRLCACR